MITVTVTATRPHRCGSRKVERTWVPYRTEDYAGYVIRNCSGCGMRIGTYDVKKTPPWAREDTHPSAS